MANEEVGSDASKIARRMIEVWTSTLDALMQEWLEKGDDDDRLGVAIASAKLSQTGAMMSAYFRNLCEELCTGKTDLKASNQAIGQVAAMITRAMEASGVGRKETPGLALSAPPDQTLN